MTAFAIPNTIQTASEEFPVSCVIPSAVGSGASTVDVTVDFGSSFTHYAETVVTGQTWVTASSKIVAVPKASSGDGIEAAVLSFQPSIGNLSAGVGFTLRVYTPIEAKGTYTFSCVGV